MCYFNFLNNKNDMKYVIISILSWHFYRIYDFLWLIFIYWMNIIFLVKKKLLKKVLLKSK